MHLQASNKVNCFEQLEFKPQACLPRKWHTIFWQNAYYEHTLLTHIIPENFFST